MSNALIVIDVQNDYFASENGGLPLPDAEPCSTKIATIIKNAQDKGWLIIGIQHEATDPQAPIFRPDSHGIRLHHNVANLLTNAPIITKHFADSFLQTELNNILQANDIKDIYLCGMMTQNCITYTTLSPQAKNYQVHIYADACAAPTSMVHAVAIRSLSVYADIIQD